MARHSRVRNLDIDEELDVDSDIIGHSLDEHEGFCMSPTTEQYMFRREGEKKWDFTQKIGEDIEEEYEEDEMKAPPNSFVLSDMERAKLQSCVEAVHNVLGEVDSSVDLHQLSVKHNFDPAAVTQACLDHLDKPKIKAVKLTQPSVSAAPLVPVRSLASGSKGAQVVQTSKLNVRTGFVINGDSRSPRAESPAGVDRSQLSKLTISTAVGDSLHPSASSPALARLTGAAMTPNKSSANLEALAKTRLKSRPAGGKDLLSLVVIGHVDAGKSTLMGHLLFLLGNVNQKTMHKYRQESQKLGKASFAYAWVLDETTEERERGVTMDIAQARFETDSKQIVLLDAPGHKDFIPNMITGAAQADVAILVVNATKGEFETGFDLGGQTREHSMLIRSLGVSQLGVAVNKLDTVDWSETRFDEIVTKMKPFLKTVGFPDPVFVPCSGLSGENLVAKPPEGHILLNWYAGPTLLQVIDGFKSPPRSVEKPLRLTISDVFRGTGSGFVISGKVETGAIQNGDKVVILPNGESAQVKSIQTDDGGLDAGVSYAGDTCLVTLLNVDMSTVGTGHVICHPESPIAVTQCFEAKVVVFNTTMPITKGFPVVVHCQSVCESGVISRLVNQLSRTSGEVTKVKPRCLLKNSSGTVEIKTEKPICLDVYEDCKEVGRITLRSAGTTIAAGLITKITRAGCVAK